MGATDFISQGIGFNAGIAKTLGGAVQTYMGNRALKKLEANRPQYQVNPLIQNIAQDGFGAQATNYYTENVNRGLGAGINAITSAGGDINQIMQLINGANNSYKQYAMANAQQKLANQQGLINEQRAAWDYNTNIPFQQSYYRAVQQTNSGAQNMYGGLSDIAGTTATMSNPSYGGKMEGGDNSYSGIGANGNGFQNPNSNQLNMNPYIQPQTRDWMSKNPYQYGGYQPQGINYNWSLGG
jgi:hypothetical protein